MRKYTFVAVVVALLLAAGAALGATGKVETAKKPAVTMQFEVVTKSLAGKMPFNPTEHYYIKGPKHRVDVTPLAGGREAQMPGNNPKSKMVTISDGRTTVRWSVGEKTAFRARAWRAREWLFPKDRPGFRRLAKKVGSEKLGDKQCDIYLLQPRQRPDAPRGATRPQGPRGQRGPWAQRGPTKVWIWTKYGLAIKQVMMDKDNKPLMMREVRKIVVGKPLADSLFLVPKGITVKDAPQGERGFGRQPGPPGPSRPR